MYFFPFHAFGAKKMYNLRYRFAQATHFKTRNVVYIVDPTLFESITHDVIYFAFLCAWVTLF